MHVTVKNDYRHYTVNMWAQWIFDAIFVIFAAQPTQHILKRTFAN
jgi:hypothetical protein